MKTNEEIAIISGLSITFAVIIYFSFVSGMELFRLMFAEFEQFFGRIQDDNFVRNGIIIKFLWELLPQTAQVVGFGAISIRLLQAGINPIIFGMITASARLISQIMLYFAGKYLANYVFKNKKKIASASHFMHKYHYIVFLIPAWVGVFGDFIMLTAGHQKISLLKIIPILYAGNLADAYRWIYWDLGQIQIVNTIQQQ